MIDFKLISSYTVSINYFEILEDEELEEEQIGNNISILEIDNLPKENIFNIAFLGVTNIQGSEIEVTNKNEINNINKIRNKFYNLYCWHNDIKIIDFGNLMNFKTIDENYTALKIITRECKENNILLIVIGGPHNLVLGQYYGLENTNGIKFTNIDSFINVNLKSRFEENTFLDQIFFNQKNSLKNYTHLAFQSFYTHPKILDILNSLNYDFYRLGYVKDNLFEIEPQIRESSLISFDLASVINYYNNNINIVNGLNGEEACLIMKFCGMANSLQTLGIYGYYSFLDNDDKMATLISQMIWYFIEGYYYKKLEGNFNENKSFETFFTSFNEIKTIFYQNKITKRWWMQHQENKKIIPCSYNDYLLVAKNEIPDRWIKGFE